MHTFIPYLSYGLGAGMENLWFWNNKSEWILISSGKHHSHQMNCRLASWHSDDHRLSYGAPIYLNDGASLLLFHTDKNGESLGGRLADTVQESQQNRHFLQLLTLPHSLDRFSIDLTATLTFLHQIITSWYMVNDRNRLLFWPLTSSAINLQVLFGFKIKKK